MVPKHHDGGICTVRGCRSGGMARPDYPPPRHRTRLPTASCSQPSDNPLTRPGGQFSPTHARSHANKVPHREVVSAWGDTSKRYHDIAFARATAPAVPITVAPRRLVTRIWLAEWTDGSAHASAPTRLRWEYDRVRSLQSANVSGRAGRRVLPARFYLRHHCMALGHR